MLVPTYTFRLLIYPSSRSHDSYPPESYTYGNIIIDIFLSLAYFSSLGKTILSFLKASISVRKHPGSFR